MKIRFSKNDVFDTKGESAEVDQLANAPIYTAELTAEEVDYIKQFVDAISGYASTLSVGSRPQISVGEPASETFSVLVSAISEQ